MMDLERSRNTTRTRQGKFIRKEGSDERNDGKKRWKAAMESNDGNTNSTP
jgi:hypothetical protein